MIRRSLMILTVLAFASLAAAASAATYEIDKVHSSVGFKVRHLGVSNVRGAFDDFSGTFAYEPGKPETWQASATIQVASVNTDNARRDEHLRSPDFFDAAKYPTMTFQSTGVTAGAGGAYKLAGDLTLHGVTKPVTLDLEIVGAGPGPGGEMRAGFSATGTINRQDFGVSFNKALETGGLVVGDEVTIVIEVEGVQKK